ncbi:NAD(P)/FAD-dependent oxidoreductase [Pseudalkalibacillus hwajinpoensis]|uniref:NAD(P)/FAD-dependent oxidoreductase n=1 Tax=Guptibacillus hwajinpoensis TaxID=208199 RepID=UPI00325B96C3
MIKKIDLLIIGGGPAGISAAIWAKRLGLHHLLLEARDELGGQLTSIYNRIIDYPGIIGENGQALKDHFIQHSREIGVNYVTHCPVSTIDWDTRVLKSHSNQTYKFRSILISTGSSPRRLDVPGEQEMINRNEVYSATRDREKFKGKTAAIVGGGDRAFEGALLLANAGATVHLIHRSGKFKARNEYRDPVLEHPSVTVHRNAVVKEISGARVKKLTVIENESIIHLLVDGIFIRIGVEPNTAPFKDGVILDQDGYVICDRVGRTSIPYVYAAGDVCTRPLLSSITSAVGQGMTAVKCLSFYLEE